MSDQDEWDKQLERLDERTAKRRANIKQLDDEVQEAIRDAEERRAANEPKEPEDDHP